MARQGTSRRHPHAPPRPAPPQVAVPDSAGLPVDERALLEDAVAKAPVGPARRRRRSRTVTIIVVLCALTLPLTLFLELMVVTDAPESPASFILAAAIAVAPFLVALVLTSDQVLADWLAPENQRHGRAHYLNPLFALADSGRMGWILGAVVLGLLWLGGGLLVDGPLGLLVGLLVGVLLTGSCLLFGILTAWLLVVPLGLLSVAGIRRDRSPQALRLALLGTLMLSLVVIAAPIAWTELPTAPGNEGVVLYLAAVVGLRPSGHFDVPGTVLLIARIGVLVLLLTLAPLLSLLRRLPQQEAAGRLHQTGLRD